MKKHHLYTALLFFALSHFITAQKSILFNDQNDFLEVADHPSLNSEELTIEFWIKVNDLGDPSQGDGEQTILDKRGDNTGYNLRLAGQVYPLPAFSFLFPEGFAAVGDFAKKSVWNHLAISRDSERLKVYVNGNIVSDDVSGNYVPSIGAALRIGQFFGYPGLDIGLQGELDEFRIWDDVRSAAEIKDNMHFGVDNIDSGLALYYDFEMLAGGNVPDLSPFNNFAVLNGSPEFVNSTAPIGYIPLEHTSYLLSYGLEGSIELEWHFVEDAIGYRIYRSDNPNRALADFDFLVELPAESLSYSDIHLEADHLYYYYITAINDLGKEGLPCPLSTSRTLDLIDFNTGVYYYPWYGPDDGGHRWEYHRGVLTPPQPPFLGEHSSRDPSIIQKHIQWMEIYSIDFLVSSWWGKDSWENTTLRDNMIPIISDSNIEFSLYFESAILGLEEGQIAISGDEIDRVVTEFAYMANNYFDHPQYLKVNGDPVVFIYLSHIFSEMYEEAFKQVRDELSLLGHNIFLVGDFSPWETFDKDHFTGFVDAVSPYITYGLPELNGYPGLLSFPNFASIEHSRVEKEIQSAGFKFIPNVFPGFNNRAIGAGNFVWPRQLVPGASHQSFFETYIKLLRPYIDDDLDMIMITSWNEWHEDTQIEPVIESLPTTTDISTSGSQYSQDYSFEGYGFKCLDAVAYLLGDGLIISGTEDEVSLEQNPAIVYPNPSSGEIIIDYFSPRSEYITLELIDLYGKKYAREKIWLAEGKNKIPLHIEGLNPGLFLLNFTGNNYPFSLKLYLKN